MSAYSFEAEDLSGNVLDVGIPPNRFSDAASHWGIAREISAILGRNFQFPISSATRNPAKRDKPQAANKSQIQNSKFAVNVQDKKLCLRYQAQYFDNIKVAESPKWLKDILADCGLRPISNVVDIMNYAMLETGQPIHAFDYDKLATSGNGQTTIIVRRAKKGEKITTLDDKKFELNKNILVIADAKNPLAIAGIKGGKLAEVDKNTKRIIVESANFNGVNIYKTSKFLKLSTDASLRYSHNISPELTTLGINRVVELLKEISRAKGGQLIDANFIKPAKKIIKFDLNKFKKLIGLDLDAKTCQKYLELLGFSVKPQLPNSPNHQLLVEVSPLRTDIVEFEDLAEEVIRLYGYNKLKFSAPRVHLNPSGFEDQIVLKDKVRKILANLGLNEVLNYSFIGEDDLKLDSGWKQKAVEVENPISVQSKYLRLSLSTNMIKNINSNFRFFDEIKIFEIGHTFARAKTDKVEEKLMLGIAFASKRSKQLFFELKGVLEQLSRGVGLANYLMVESAPTDNCFIPQEILKIESDNTTLGFLGRLKKELVENYEAVFAEIDLEKLLKLIEEEHEYQPLPKYPSVMRDVSILVEPEVKVGEITQAIQEYDLKNIEDVDLVDEFDLPEGKVSLTFRIIFQAEDRTLTDREVNSEMEKISKMLEDKFNVTIR